MGYSKLFSEIVMSTIWREPDTVRIVWITMLALKDRWHIVNASIPGLADASRVSVEDCRMALEKLSAPDPDSRSSEFDGRRIEKCEGGWIILNGEKYRNKMNLDERREYNRVKQKEYYHKRKNLNSSVQSSTNVNQISSTCTHTESDTEADTNKRIKHMSPSETPEFLRFWKEYPRKEKKPEAVRAFYKHKFSKELLEMVVADVARRKDTEVWQKDGGQFIPLPASYLNQRRWEDEGVEKPKTWQEKFIEETS